MNRRDESLRAKCELLLDQLAICRDVAANGGVGMDDIRAQVQRLRGRPLNMIPVLARPGGPTGVWIETAMADYVFFDRATSRLHRLHIVFHEVGHMMLRHTLAAGSLHRRVGHSCAALARDQAISIALRTAPHTVIDEHDCDQEREAEVFATIGCQRVGDIAVPTVAAVAEDDRELLRRLVAALSDDRLDDGLGDAPVGERG
jgi:hypothetical protein